MGKPDAGFFEEFLQGEQIEPRIPVVEVPEGLATATATKAHPWQPPLKSSHPKAP